MDSKNLHMTFTSFIGREREIADVQQLCSDARLVTLTGAGGCGKTRLALQVAKTISESLQDGVWIVKLASLSDPTLVPQVVSQTLGVPASPEQPVLDSLLDYLESKELLLVLDNCEHLIASCAQLVQEILSHAHAVRILSTSREPLAVVGEAIYPVSGLSWPDAVDESLEYPQELLQYAAVRLFVERTRAVLPNFTITNANAQKIVQICMRLDGMPLALELASARANVLSLQQIAERLDDRFTLLVSWQRSEPDPRHHTLRATIDWSYDLLSMPEQVLLRRLSVFSGGFSLETAETVCCGEGVEREQLLELLSSLVNKSLVVAHTFLEGEARYHLLETIHQYTQEKLISSGEWSVIHDQHLQFFLQLSEETDTKLRGEDQQLWLNRLDTEYDNIRTALAWAVEGGRQDGGRVSAGLRITTSLYQFWRIRDYTEEGLNWCKQLFAVANDDISAVVRANALAFASLMAGIRGQFEEQMTFGEEAVLFGEAAGQEGKQALTFALGAQGYAARKVGDYQTAFSLTRRQIQLLREVGDDYHLGLSLSLNSFFAMSIGIYEEAHAMLEEALPLLRKAGDPYRIAMALNYMGDLARCEQNYQQAQTVYTESISLLRKINAVRDLASALNNLGHACLHLGNTERAKDLFSESMTLHREQGNRPGMTECLLGFAALAIIADSPAAGARLLSAAAAIGGQHIKSEWAATRMEYEHYLERARAGLVKTAFQAEQAAGQRLTLEQAVEYAQNLHFKPAALMESRENTNPLTTREQGIATLIAQGKSNGEIASELVISKRTVEKHIANILIKLGFTNRAQIVRWAIEAGLVKATG
jgi:predicted ATPase/DNA-binding CsgD family transcriptional regulator